MQTLTTIPQADSLPETAREDTMRPVKLTDMKAGTWLISDREDEVVSRRRLIVEVDRSLVMSVSDTGHIMIAACKPETLFNHYTRGWRVEK